LECFLNKMKRLISLPYIFINNKIYFRYLLFITIAYTFFIIIYSFYNGIQMSFQIFLIKIIALIFPFILLKSSKIKNDINLDLIEKKTSLWLYFNAIFFYIPIFISILDYFLLFTMKILLQEEYLV